MTVTESEALNALLGDLMAAKAKDAPEAELQALVTRCSLTLLSYKVRPWTRISFPSPPPTPHKYDSTHNPCAVASNSSTA